MLAIQELRDLVGLECHRYEYSVAWIGSTIRNRNEVSKTTEPPSTRKWMKRITLLVDTEI